MEAAGRGNQNDIKSYSFDVQIMFRSFPDRQKVRSRICSKKNHADHPIERDFAIVLLVRQSQANAKESRRDSVYVQFQQVLLRHRGRCFSL